MNNQELRIELLLEEVVKKRASDLHLQVDLPPMLRIDGSLQPIPGYDVLDEPKVEALVYAILDQDQQQILEKDKEFDFSFAFGNLGRFRVNAFHERGNLAAALRLIPNEIKSVTELGMPPVVMNFADYPRGLVLVTGPTGSGKSTTLAALVDKINSERADHIITIGDPIEFTHKSKKSVVVQREVHYDTYSFSAASFSCWAAMRFRESSSVPEASPALISAKKTLSKTSLCREKASDSDLPPSTDAVISSITFWSRLFSVCSRTVWRL